jgi:signal transduction histidine kinase
MADPTRVRQIVRNLITNALRYGGSTITVTTGSRGETAYVQVRDDGPGIPEEKRDRIFEPYESAHEAVGMPGSVGLGLTISRKLARLLGGDLSYRSDGGSLFELTLPAADHVASAAAAQEIETPLSWSSLLS